MDGYGSHLPLLEEIFKLRKIDSVLEFGCGDFSTDFFVKNCNDVTSIEMQSDEWFFKISNQFKKFPNWKGILCVGPREFESLNIYKKVDLCFVDGHGDSRPDVINFMQIYSDIFVAHDTETFTYYWGRINFFREIYSFQYKKFSPCTTVWSSDFLLIGELSKRLG
jgi:hypothetical protein